MNNEHKVEAAGGRARMCEQLLQRGELGSCSFKFSSSAFIAVRAGGGRKILKNTVGRHILQGGENPAGQQPILPYWRYPPSRKGTLPCPTFLSVLSAFQSPQRFLG
jgi:hypothetical protein